MKQNTFTYTHTCSVGITGGMDADVQQKVRWVLDMAGYMLSREGRTGSTVKVETSLLSFPEGKDFTLTVEVLMEVDG